MKVEVFHLNSFTYHGQGGNPAGVVLSGDVLTDAQMQAVAGKMGFSETAFILPDTTADFHLRFFTPASEIDFCGHATLAAFSLMRKRDIISAGQYCYRTKSGILTVSVYTDNCVVMSQNLPTFSDFCSTDEISEILGVHKDVLSPDGQPIRIVSTGLPDAIIPVQPGTLDTIQPDYDQLAIYSRKKDIVGFHLFELNPQGDEFNASCRNFAPLYGIAEESATGSSCGALACYLSKFYSPPISCDFRFEQGRAMGSRSSISASVQSTSGLISAVTVGGNVNLMGSVEVVIEE